MAWNSINTRSPSDTPVLADVLNDLADDDRAWGGPVDAAGYALANLGAFRLDPQTLPVSPTAGTIVCDIADGLTKQYDGAAWYVIGGAAAGATGPAGPTGPPGPSGSGANNSTDFDFSIAPGGSLAVGANTVTLSPFPDGIDADSVGIHYLRISGGTGAAETVLITARSSTTVTFTCANTHTGAFTVASATAGIQEAIIASTGQSVYIPGGTHLTYGTISVPTTKSPEIYGAGPVNSLLSPQATTGDVLSYVAANALGFVNVHDIGITAVGHTTGYGLAVRDMNNGFVRRIYFYGGANCLLIEGGNGISTEGIVMLGFTNLGVYIHATAVTGGKHHNWLASANSAAYACLEIQAETGGAVAGMNFSDFSLQLGTYNIYLHGNGGVINECLFSNMILDSASGWAFLADGTGGDGIHLSNVRVATAGTISGCFNILSGYSNVSIVGGSCAPYGGGTCIKLSGPKNVTLADLTICGSGTTGGSDVALQIVIDGSTVANNIHVHNCTIGLSNTGTTGGNRAYYGLNVDANAHTNLKFTHNKIYGASYAVGYSGTGTGCLFRGNQILNPATKPTAAAGIRGSDWYVESGSGVADTYQICRKDAADAYAWVTLF